jgi:ABC-2 type transport system permease protein
LNSARGLRARRQRDGVLVALLMGFRSGAGVLAWLAVAGILIAFTLALTWIAVIPGLSAKSTDGVSAFSYPLIFLPFISSAFVPTDTMPGPVPPSPSTSR